MVIWKDFLHFQTKRTGMGPTVDYHLSVEISFVLWFLFAHRGGGPCPVVLNPQRTLESPKELGKPRKPGLNSKGF